MIHFRLRSVTHASAKADSFEASLADEREELSSSMGWLS